MSTAERFFIDYETFKAEVDERFQELETDVEVAFTRVKSDLEIAYDRIRKLEALASPFLQPKADPPTPAPGTRNIPVVTICYPDGTETVIPLNRSLSLLDSSSEGARDRWALISALNQEKA